MVVVLSSLRPASIAHVTDFFAPRVGGIETQVAELARAQVATGRDVHVITTTPAADRMDGGVWPFAVRRISPIFAGRSAVRPVTAGRIGRVLDELAPDLVHVHVSAVSPCAWYAVHWAMQRHRPVVASVHSPWGSCAGPFHRMLDRWTGWSDHVVLAPVSASVATFTRRAIPSAVTMVVPNGIDPRFWRNLIRTHRVDDFHVVSVGRLVPRRGSMALLEVLRAARARLGGRLRATIAGAGPDGPRMAGYLRRNGMAGWVRLPGQLRPDGVRTLLAGADVYVSAAARESFGIAALEARTSGLPVVTFAGTGTADFIRHEREGLLCRGTAGLADGIVRLANDRDLRHSIAAHNSLHAPTCTWPTVLAAFDESYARAVERAHTRQPPRRAGVATDRMSPPPVGEGGRTGPVRKAIILAAGKGTRLGSAAQQPKPLTPVNGTPILHRALACLAAVGVHDVVIVVGYRADEIIASTGHRFAEMTLTYRHSDAFERTNNAYSLWLARAELDQDLFLMDADVLFDSEILQQLAASQSPLAIAVAPRTAAMKGTTTRLDGDQVRSVHLIDDQPTGVERAELFKTVNISLLRADYLATHFVPRLERLIERGDHHAFYDAVIAETVNESGVRARAIDCRDLRWWEVDEPADVVAAECRFGAPERRLDTLNGQHGSYWRLGVTDHSLLYNLHFPPEELWRILSAELRDALVHYPAGQRTMRALLGAAIGQPVERLAVANGACELITTLGRLLGGVVLVSPGFAEYESACDPKRTRHVELAWPEFLLDVEHVCLTAVDMGAEAVVVTSPNNATGVAVPRQDLIHLSVLLARHGIRLVVDESFVDFCAENQSLEPLLGDLPNVLIVKSMSKVYGLAGVRLGYLAASDTDLVSEVIAGLPIWNVNGLAESLLRHLPRFDDAFQDSLTMVRADRDALHADLSNLDGVSAIRSDTNFILARLAEPWTAPELTLRLLDVHNMLIKDCTKKSMCDSDQYVRIASRNRADNQRLVAAIAQTLKD